MSNNGEALSPAVPASSAAYDDDDDDDDEPPILVALGGAPPASGKPVGDDDEHEDAPPCPVTILSGFLGSGKTTLIQYILKSPNHGKRIAVIENEFGEGLQVESLIARDGVNDSSLTDLIELANGCICCKIKDSLVVTLENLLDKRQDLDYILIECSGMANPGPIASLFWLDEALESRLRLDGIVTLVDAKHITKQLSSTEEAAQQVAYADRILLNKIDLLTTSNTVSVDSLTRKLRRLNPTAPIRPTEFSTVPDLDWILDAQCFDPDRLSTDIDSSSPVVTDEAATDTEGTASDHDHHNHEHSHDHDNSDCPTCNNSNAAAPIQQKEHEHTDAVTSISLTETGRVDLEKVNKWLASILWPQQDEQNRVLNSLIEEETAETHEQQQQQASSEAHKKTKPLLPEIFRIKGVLAVHQQPSDDCNEDDPRRHIVQAVHDLWEIHPASDSLQWKPDEERQCKLVVIGRYLPTEELRQGFRSCLV